MNAVGPDKDEVVEVANAVAEAFVIEMSNITENGDARILDKAKFAEKDVNAQKNILKVVGIFAIGGAVFMCILSGIERDFLKQVSNGKRRNPLWKDQYHWCHTGF